MALQVLWYIFSLCFHFFNCVLGKKPPCFLARCDNGGVGCVIQVCSMHRLRDLVISCNLFCATFHCVWVRCSFCSNYVRFSIFRFCFVKEGCL